MLSFHDILVAIVASLGLLRAGSRISGPTLGLLVLAGYADPSLVGDFDTKHGCKMSASYMGASDRTRDHFQQPGLRVIANAGE